MSIIKRDTLKAQFKSGATPTAQDFSNLIDSVLVKRDDIFFGKWQQGIVYYTDDVVIHANQLYRCELQPPEESLCSTTPPDGDPAHWKVLKLKTDNEDWAVIPADPGAGMDIMYALVFGKIGMGTEDPRARVHIYDDQTGASYLFAPDGTGIPEFRIGKSDQQLSLAIAERRARIATDQAGLVFELQQRAPSIPQAQTDQQAQTEVVSYQVFVTVLNNSPAIGAGTLSPAAALHLTTENKEATLLLNPGNRSVPEIVWNHYHTESRQQHCLSALVNESAAQFTTNAPGGFAFIAGLEYCDDYIKDGTDRNAHTVLAIKPDNKVGIGTAMPEAHLDVTDHQSGQFKLSLKKTNPALAVVNIRPGGQSANYLTLGANNECSIFITDSQDGFAFRKGKEYEKSRDEKTRDEKSRDFEVDIDQEATDLMKISADAKVVIGEEDQPGGLNVIGFTRALEQFIDNDGRRISNIQDLDDNTLGKVKQLHPVKFNWKDKYMNNASPEDRRKEHYGFLPHEVADIFPGLVNSKAVAYANMTAILVKAIQEQQGQIDELKKKLDRLR